MPEDFDLTNHLPDVNMDRPAGPAAVRYVVRGAGTQNVTTAAASPGAVYLDDLANAANFRDLQPCGSRKREAGRAA